MRKRSNTIHSENVNDYVDAMQRLDSRTLQPRRPACRRTAKPVHQDQKLDELPSTSNDVEESDPFWDHFDVDCEHLAPDQDRRAMTMPSLTLSDNTVDTDCSEEADPKLCKKNSGVYSVPKRVMVIGMNGAGKHSLINTLFGCEELVADRKSQVMDLLLKTEEDEEDGSPVRYQFWIQNLFGDFDTRKHKLEELIKVYYKNVSLFVFMYCVDDKKSFECLDGAIQSVLKEIPAEKFRGVLLANKGNLGNQREVSPAEGVMFQDKYKLIFFMETSCSDKCLKDKLIHILREKDQGELGTKKGHSILSID